MTDPEVLFEDDLLRVTMLENPDAPEAASLISFSGVGQKAAGGIELQTDEFFAQIRRYRRVFFVVDRSRSWGNALDFDQLREVVLGQTGDAAELHTLGNSMGGFLALLSTRFLPVTHALAIAPQYSMHPDEPPHEARWADYRDQITEWRFPSLEGRIAPDTHAIALFGSGPKDEGHRRRFESDPAVTCITVRNGSHRVAKKLKNLGHLNTVIERALSGDLTQDWVNENVRIVTKAQRQARAERRKARLEASASGTLPRANRRKTPKGK